MSIKNRTTEKSNKRKRQSDGKSLKWYSVDQVFKKASKKEAFKRAYHEEIVRIEIARAIRNARTEKKMTQAAVAKRASMPQSVIARLESGNHSVSLETLGKVAHALGKHVKLV